MESFKVTHLTVYAFTKWGERYSNIKWDPFWKSMLETATKETKYNKRTLTFIITWFDLNVLQKFPLSIIQTPIKDSTLDVNMRILCGMVNNLPYDHEYKIQIVNCFHSTFKHFYISWMDWHCKKIWELPF